MSVLIAKSNLCSARKRVPRPEFGRRHSRGRFTGLCGVCRLMSIQLALC
jgi:hypothetical protein